MPDIDEPRLTVRLKTDEAGRPAFIDGRRFRHYKVVSEVENAPADAFAATFDLDPAYYDPSRTVQPQSTGRFRLETTTYGDFPLTVRLRRSKGEDIVLKEGVARALRRAYAPAGAEMPFGQAVSYITEH